ncbi:MAG: DUF2630 family protein [Frankia sp.]
MDEKQIRHTIAETVAEEHQLRGKGATMTAEDRVRLRHLEESLDQCWDLLRQRDALRHAGVDPATATARSTGEVEGYLQ